MNPVQKRRIVFEQRQRVWELVYAQSFVEWKLRRMDGKTGSDPGEIARMFADEAIRGWPENVYPREG